MDSSVGIIAIALTGGITVLILIEAFVDLAVAVVVFAVADFPGSGADVIAGVGENGLIEAAAGIGGDEPVSGARKKTANGINSAITQ